MKTVSDKQLAANRANAAKSTGPRTPEGKARAALNSRKHSLTAAAVTMLRIEDHGELDNLRADALTHYQPQTSQEIFAVERIAVCQLMMIRGWRLEAGMFIAGVDRVLNDDGTGIFRLHAELYPDSEIHIAQNRNFAIAEGFQRMTAPVPHVVSRDPVPGPGRAPIPPRHRGLPTPRPRAPTAICETNPIPAPNRMKRNRKPPLPTNPFTNPPAASNRFRPPPRPRRTRPVAGIRAPRVQTPGTPTLDVCPGNRNAAPNVH